MNIINASLPVIIKVLAKTGWGRYSLLFGTREVSTKSSLNLIIGAEYFANIAAQSGGVININTLNFRDAPKNVLFYGAEVLNGLQDGTITDWGAFLKSRLKAACDEGEFAALCDMALAWGDGVLHLPYFDGKSSLIQIKNGDIFVMAGSFAPVIFTSDSAKITHLKSPYKAAAAALGGLLKCPFSVAATPPLWTQNSGLVNRLG